MAVEAVTAKYFDIEKFLQFQTENQAAGYAEEDIGSE